MRNTLLGLFLLSASALYAADPVPVSSEIKEVTVFLSGAQVTRTANIRLESGSNEIRLTDLSPQINAGSIQVKGNNKFTILSVNHRMNHLDEISKTREIEKLVEQRLELQFRSKQRKTMKSVYEDERKMLQANRAIKGKNPAMDIEDLKEMADYYRSRMKEIEYKLLEIGQDLKRLDEEERKINQQLQNLQRNVRKNTSEIILSLAADNPGSTTISVSYMVTSAGWTPVYDIRTKEVDAPVTLIYKSKVWQQSGYDWDDVKLKLSTGNPSKSGTQPTVNPWVLYLNPIETYTKNRNRNSNGELVGVMSRPGWVASDSTYVITGGAPAGSYNLALEDKEKGIYDYTTAIVTNINTEFDIEIPYDIPTDGKYYDVEIRKHTVPAEYNYFTAPKFDTDAFLLARLTDWDGFNLLPGNAHIYYQGTYVGKSYLNTQVTSDTLDVSLGRDKGIVVERKKIKEFNKTSNVGSSRKTQIGMEINIRNTKSKSVQITIVDQIPISKRREIVVEMMEAKGAEYNKETGKLTWKATLGPGESVTHVLKYTVKYPKDQVIPNL